MKRRSAITQFRASAATSKQQSVLGRARALHDEWQGSLTVVALFHPSQNQITLHFHNTHPFRGMETTTKTGLVSVLNQKVIIKTHDRSADTRCSNRSNGHVIISCFGRESNGVNLLGTQQACRRALASFAQSSTELCATVSSHTPGAEC
jgi:hypothetical protein